MSSPLRKDGRGAPHGRPSPPPDVLKQGDEFGVSADQKGMHTRFADSRAIPARVQAASLHVS